MHATSQHIDDLESAVDALPLDTRFELGPEITDIQRAFLERHGYLIFGGVATADEVAKINAEVDRIESDWVTEGRTSVNGVPIFKGVGLEEKPMMRNAFPSRPASPTILRNLSALSDSSRFGD